MTNTAETIEKLKTFQVNVNESMLNREIVSFQLGDIDIDKERLSINGDALSENAVKKVLSQLRVKNNFLELSKQMTPTDWDIVKDKLKRVKSGQIIHGRKVEVEGVKSIDDIYMAAPKTTGIMEIDSVFSALIDSMISTAKDVSLKSTSFLEDKDEVHVTLLENENLIDIFSNETDMWKTGKKLVWNGMNFSVSPFFERLVCSNGNTAPQYGFKANISNNKFNFEKIKAVLDREITFESDTMENYLVDSTNHLNSCNVSVREFLKFKSFFNENEHGTIIQKWFDDTKLNQTYGCIVADMPDLWKITADSGKNAYSFFNDLTYIASHPEEVKISDRNRVELQIKASDLLFRAKMDLELVAPTFEKINEIWN